MGVSVSNLPLIILAEDDADQREVLSEILEHEGYRVIGAKDASELLAQLARHPRAVLMDMHGVASIEVIEKLEKMPIRPALILISGDTSVKEFAARVSADAYFQKPYDLEPLLSSLKKAIERRQ